ESHALELNPVAYLIDLCTIDFPQRFGPSLADDVERWGRQILERTKAAVSDVLAQIPRPPATRSRQHNLTGSGRADLLSIVAYYWTRTVPCPNPQCRGTVPLYRQTWLRQKRSKYVALRAEPDLTRKVVCFRVVEASTESGLGFDPSEGLEGSA